MHEDILNCLDPTSWQSGRLVRAAVNEGRPWWRKHSIVGFYWRMWKLEAAGLVEFKQGHEYIGGEKVVDYLYRLKQSGDYPQ